MIVKFDFYFLLYDANYVLGVSSQSLTQKITT